MSIAAMKEIELPAEVVQRLGEAVRSNHRVLVYLTNECIQRGIFNSILNQFINIRDNPGSCSHIRRKMTMRRGY